MVNYPHHLKLLLLLLCSLALGLGQENLEPLHRNKRTLTTICVEIQPNGPQNEPYFMCKGADFSNGATPASPPQSIYNSPQSGAQMLPQAPFPSFPSFGAGFFPAPTSYEDASSSKLPVPTPPPSSNQESHGAQYGSAGAAAFAPASAPQPYGLPAVSYPAAGGPAAAPSGAYAGPRPAATPTAYADAGPKKPSPVGQTTPMHKPQPASGQTSNGHEYRSPIDSRHRVALDDGVLGMPNVGFQPEELNTQYRRPSGVMEPPMMLVQLPQPAPVPHPYYDDHIMRTFYESLGHQEPQVAQATPLGQQADPIEPLVVPAYPGPEVPPPAPPTPPPPPPSALPTNNVYPKTSSPLDGNACNSCNRPCSAAAENCPSFQPVIIAMPCYGQQQPTHYLAVPGAPGPNAASMPRDSAMMGSPFGGSFGMQPQVGSPYGLGQQVGSAYGMSAPQVGSPFGMGGPFGMAPMMNPFGPFGSLNPFNPFNRILGAQASTTAQPRMRLFGETTATTSMPIAPQFQQPIFQMSSTSSTLAPPIIMSSEATNVPVISAQDKDADDDTGDEEEVESQEATEHPRASDTTVDDEGPELSKSLESKEETFDDMVKKGEDKIKSDKRKRQNSRYSNSSSQSQKRKYLQRL